MEFFGRKLKVMIGNESEGISYNGDLKINISVVKDILKSEPDQATITIYNLNEQSRSNLLQKFKKIAVLAGYQKEAPVFIGEIQTVQHVKEGVDWVTSIVAGDGAKAISQSYMSKTYKAGTSVRQIMKDMSAAMGAEAETVDGGFENFVLPRGKTIDTSAKEAIDQLAATYNFDWSIQSGKLIVVPHGKARNDSPYLISSKTGMIGSPEFIDIGKHGKTKVEKEKKGIKFKTFLIPDFVPGKLVVVESDSLKGQSGTQVFEKEGRQRVRGTYKINHVEHTIETLDGEFASVVEAEIFHAA